MNPRTIISRSGVSGFSVTELLVSLFLSTLLFGGLMKQYSMSVALSHDHKVRIATILQAQAILQSVGSEIRILGNGVPFDQSNFEMGESTLSDPLVTDPIETASATATHSVFRLNETGDQFLLTQDFDPAASTTISLTETTSIDVNDPIYLSNSVVAGDDGLYGVVTAVNHAAKTVTIAAGYVAPPGATFDMGSVLEEVPQITYDSPVDGSGIRRDSGFGSVLMAERSTLALRYLDGNGAEVSTPFTRDDLINRLRAIEVTITHTSKNDLHTGQPYTAQVRQVYAIRNLNLVY